ncbi:hypothetical protein VIGAN_07088200 [Vigna angularis var. angularis]|uniref:Uncharacterized protein n=1 Tax=Vigna angularis var. angularis TaxID=157739 RepID=A0A0S3SHC4_PHAAN|nr:hypothetical protein VIGAN_07088200 [Vigna angularis var. angularis]
MHRSLCHQRRPWCRCINRWPRHTWRIWRGRFLRRRWRRWRRLLHWRRRRRWVGVGRRRRGWICNRNGWWGRGVLKGGRWGWWIEIGGGDCRWK